MKKLLFKSRIPFILFLGSGLLLISMLVLFVTAILDFNHDNGKAIIKGNEFYIEGNYQKALDAYKDGLKGNIDEPHLNYNTGLASYRLSHFDEAAKYYSKASETVEKYLKSGNSSLKLGDGGKDDNQKLQFYQKALGAYKQGILKFPENVPLKYNYEYAKKKIDELSKNNQNQQNSENNQENKENKDNQDNQNKNNQQGNEGKDQNQDKQDQNSKGNQEENKQPGDSKQEDSQKKDEKKNQNGSNENSNQGNPSPSPSQQQNKGGSDGENKEQGKEQNNQDKNQSNGQSGGSMNESDAKEGQDREALMQAQRVLEMLEQQEEESLKNNQGVKVNGKEAEHDW